MSNLAAFMAQNAIQIENQKIIVSKRFVDEKGNPVPWEAKSIDKMTDDDIRKRNTKRIPVKGKPGAFSMELDTNKYLAELAVECTVFPNLNDKELQDSYHVMGATDLLNKMLKPGEFNDYIQKIQQMNGFDLSMDELTEEAKN